MTRTAVIRTLFRSAAPPLCAVLCVAVVAACSGRGVGDSQAPAARIVDAPKDILDLRDTQIRSLQFVPAVSHSFAPHCTAVGSIDFDEDRAVAVFPPYAGRIGRVYVRVGDSVRKGQPLYTIDSPDLIQAESTLIAAAGVYRLTTEALARARGLYAAQGIAQKDLQQAVSDQQTAAGNYDAARKALRLLGRSRREIEAIAARRRVDRALVVTSPVVGQVTARVAQAGLYVQPGTAPAPVSVADRSTVWMNADVAEADLPRIRKGAAVRAQLMAFPDREFAGTVDVVGAAVDPGTHTAVVRSALRDPGGALHPGMLAHFVIQAGDPVVGVAVPPDAVVREGDGTMTVWVTIDQRHFTRRVVKTGMRQDGLVQIVDGLPAGEMVVGKGALLLSNLYAGTPE